MGLADGGIRKYNYCDTKNERLAPGKLVIYNQGYYPFVAKFMLMLTDRAFLTEIMARIAHTLPSYKVIKENIQRNDSNKMSSSSKKKNNRAKSVSRRRKKKN